MVAFRLPGGGVVQLAGFARQSAPPPCCGGGAPYAAGVRSGLVLSGRARRACVTSAVLAPSLLQSRAQPQGLADGPAHPPFGPLGAPRCPGQRSDLPCLVLPLGLGQHLAASFTSQLATHMWGHIHVTHLLSARLIDGRASAIGGTPVECGRAWAPGRPVLTSTARYRSPCRAQRRRGLASMRAWVRSATGGRPRPDPPDTWAPGTLRPVRWADRCP